MTLRFPLIAPQPPRASQLGDAFARLERVGIYSNFGPEVRRFEAEATARLFGGRGATLSVANATLGLMIAIREAAARAGRPNGYALMPAVTFAATAQAAIWAGLTPLVCDIDPADWTASAAHEDALIAEHGSRISVVVPYAAFGAPIDLARYQRLSERHGVGVVVDAASSLGTRDAEGVNFGSGAPFSVVYSMQATKPFAVGEGGLIHARDTALIERLRAMANFGFEAPRTASLPGINAKLPEVLAVIARETLAHFDTVVAHRARLEAAYREALPDFAMQPVPRAGTRAIGFMPVLLPAALAARRAGILDALAQRGVGAATYFSPHLGQQDWFQRSAILPHTPHADDIAGRILSLPATDAMTVDDAIEVAGIVRDVCGVRRVAAGVRATTFARTLIVGGGPAGTAMLLAAAKDGRLADLAQGLVVVERGDTLGAGRLGRYAINSDSTAHTFLSAVADNPEPALAALADHPAARIVDGHRDAIGVPLAATGPLLEAVGERIGALVERAGGAILKRHEAVDARRGADGRWHVRLRRLSDGDVFTIVADNLVIATGGHQPLDALVRQTVAGASLWARVGDRLLQSDEVLAEGGLARVADLLSGIRNPKVAVVGGSTSALTSIALLLRSRNGIPFGAGGITLLHRRALRPFYPSAEAALAEGFTDFGADDICPVSGFVYRLGGFRLEARELVLRMLGIDGRAPDPRVALHRIGDDEASALQVLDDAHLVIAALGYRPRILPLFESGGAPLALAADTDAPMVDGACRIVDPARIPVPGLYGIGLAAGFVPSGHLGGEASFRGQANGLWLWQNDVGRMIVDAVLDRRAAVAA